MNPDVWAPRIKAILAVTGLVLVAIAHAGVITQPHVAQLIGELGALLAGKVALKRLGDYAPQEHQAIIAELVESMRPPPPPPDSGG